MKHLQKVSDVGKRPACGQGALTRIPAIWQFPVGEPTKKPDTRSGFKVIEFGFYYILAAGPSSSSSLNCMKCSIAPVFNSCPHD